MNKVESESAFGSSFITNTPLSLKGRFSLHSRSCTLRTGDWIKVLMQSVSFHSWETFLLTLKCINLTNLEFNELDLIGFDWITMNWIIYLVLYK